MCSDAECIEEITNYIRYQASRTRGPWRRDFADVVIAKIDAELEPIVSAIGETKEASQDRIKVAAWHLYAVYLTRAFTYWKQVESDKKQDENQGKKQDKKRGQSRD